MTKVLFLLFVVYPWFLFFGSHLRLPGLLMWSGDDAIDQYLIPSCLVSVPVTSSIRVAVGNHGHMCVRRRLPDTVQSATRRCSTVP